jgi:hypothetical protein
MGTVWVGDKRRGRKENKKEKMRNSIMVNCLPKNRDINVYVC